MLSAMRVYAQTPTPTPAPEVLNAGGRYEENNPLIVFDGTWSTESEVLSSSGSYATSTDAGAVVSFYMRGNALVIYQTVTTTAGLLEICIGETCTSIDSNHIEDAWQIPFLISGFPYGVHEVLITRVSGDALTFDAIDVLDTRAIEESAGTRQLTQVFNVGGEDYEGVTNLSLSAGEIGIVLLLVMLVVINIGRLVFDLWQKQ